jgi:hypothetical protein
MDGLEGTVADDADDGDVPVLETRSPGEGGAERDVGMVSSPALRGSRGPHSLAQA